MNNINSSRQNGNNQYTVEDIIAKKKKLTNKDKRLEKFTWGIGLEHEMQYFHAPKISITNPKKDKVQNHIIYNTIDGTLSLVESKKVNILEKEFLENIPFETTGRKCHGKWVLKRTPVPMPEFVTKKPFSTIQNPLRMSDYYKELLDYEWKFSHLLHNESKLTLKQIDKYGTLAQYPYGMSNYIKMAKNYNVLNYRFEEDLITDYLGSFHVTMTLPFEQKEKYSNKEENEFIEKHENFANMFQWIEPLLVSTFFSSDQKAVGTKEKRVRGSFRIMRVGWGNLAGSNVREFKEGIGRYADIESYWRNGLDLYEVNKLKPCFKPNPKLKEKTAVSSLSSDIRTFGSTDPERPQHRESGAPMTIPNGIEIRIFDHFETIFLISMLRIISLVAANSYLTKTTKYVYENKGWINTTHSVMEDGWKAKHDKEYKNELETQFGIKLKNCNNCHELLKEVVKKLWEKNKDSDILYILDGNNTHRPEVPNINKGSWDLGFILKCSNNDKVFNRFKKLYKNIKKEGTINDFHKTFNSIFKESKWDKNCIDVFYFMKEKEIIRYKNGIYKKNEEWEDFLPYILNWEVFVEFFGFNMRQWLDVLKKNNDRSDDNKYFLNLIKRLNKKYGSYDKYI